MKGVVLQKNADKFKVDVNGNIRFIGARNLKKEGIFVGDKVEVENEVISKVLERKNLLIRPPLANVDTLIIVVAPVPKPDFLLVDKLIIFSVVKGIKPVLCVNKTDLDGMFLKEVKRIYKGVVQVEGVSSLDESVMKIKKHIKGITALAGQSAVGKSSIINALLKENVAVVGEFSKKVERGKQTTRIVELYEIEKGRFLADTAGFSKLSEEYLEIDESELKSYYPDFLKYAEKCRYKSCRHTGGDCGVLRAVEEGKISKMRYENYKIILANLKNAKKF